MGRVSREARLTFIMLWTLADDAGRLRGNSRMLASLLFPYDDDAKNLIEGWMAELSSEGCIARYEVQGTGYVQISNWLDHQKIDKPSPSKIPEFVKPSRKVAKPREDSSADQDQGMDQGREGKGSACAAPQSDAPPAATLPLIDGTEFPVTSEAVAEWQAAYPAVDVEQQLRQMRQWCIAHPANRKTRKGIAAFVVGWLGKEQNRAPTTRPGSLEPEWRAEQRRRVQQAVPSIAAQPAAEFFDVEAKRVATHSVD